VIGLGLWVLNATFNNTSVIWRSVNPSTQEKTTDLAQVTDKLAVIGRCKYNYQTVVATTVLCIKIKTFYVIINK